MENFDAREGRIRFNDAKGNRKGERGIRSDASSSDLRNRIELHFRCEDKVVDSGVRRSDSNDSGVAAESGASRKRMAEGSVVIQKNHCCC